MVRELNGPVPGQSLTSTPGTDSWERAPEMNDPEEALEWHLHRLQSEESITATLDALELGVDVVSLTKGILRASVAEGIHSIDVSMIIAPVIHEQIRGVADAAGIEFEEGLPKEQDRTKIQYAINQRKAQQTLDRLEEALGDDPTLEELPPVEEPVTAPEGVGLMVPRGEEIT